MLKLVVDCDADHISPCRMYGWPWERSVDEETHFVTTASSVACAIGDVERVTDSIASSGPFL
jgi:glucose/arabinose dehydrogenase